MVPAGATPVEEEEEEEDFEAEEGEEEDFEAEEGEEEGMLHLVCRRKSTLNSVVWRLPSSEFVHVCFALFTLVIIY